MSQITAAPRGFTVIHFHHVVKKGSCLDNFSDFRKDNVGREKVSVGHSAIYPARS